MSYIIFVIYWIYIRSILQVSGKAAEGKENRMPDINFRKKFEIREVRPEETEEAAGLEGICFPANEACAPAQMRARAVVAPELFLVAVDREAGRLAGSINGLATEETVFRDAFFEDAGLHRPEGKNIMMLGLVVLPEYRGLGLAREIGRAHV